MSCGGGTLLCRVCREARVRGQAYSQKKLMIGMAKEPDSQHKTMLHNLALTEENTTHPTI